MVGVAFGTLLFAGIAAADPTCTTGTLVSANAINGTTYTPTGELGGSSSCNIDGLDFSNFMVYVGTGFPSPGSELNVGVDFTSSGGEVTVAFNESITAGDDLEVEFAIKPGVSSDLLAVGSGGTNEGVNETVCSVEVAFTSSCTASGGTILGSGSAPAGGSDLITITPNSVDYVSKDVDGVSEFSQTVAPEPMSLSLMGLGLLGIGLVGRRIRK